MAATVLEELSVLLSFQTDASSKAQAEKSVSSLREGMQGLASFAVGDQLRTALVGITVGAIDAGSEINDLSERLGISTDVIQEFGYAASLAGGSAQDAATGMRNLARLSSEAAGGSAEAAKAFAALGVSAVDASGKARPVADLLPEIADGFAQLEEGPERVAAAMTLLGKAGADLIPVLSQGSKGLEAVYAEAQRLGLIVSKDTIAALDAAGDEMGAFQTGIQSLKLSFGGQLAPTFERFFRFLRMEVTPRLLELVKTTNLAKYATGALSVAMGVLFGGTVMKGLRFLGFIKEGTGGIGGMTTALLKVGPIVALVGLLALAFEDLYTWITGGESASEELFTSMLGAEGAHDLLVSLQEAFSGMGEAVDALLPAVSNLLSLLLKGFAYALPVITKVLDAVLTFASAIAEALGTVIKVASAIGGAIGKGSFGEAAEQIDQAILGDKSGKILDKGMKRAFGIQDYAVTQNTAWIDDPHAQQKAIMGGDNTVHQNNSIQINLPPGADAMAVGGAVKGALGDERQAAYAAQGGG